MPYTSFYRALITEHDRLSSKMHLGYKSLISTSQPGSITDTTIVFNHLRRHLTEQCPGAFLRGIGISLFGCIYAFKSLLRSNSCGILGSADSMTDPGLLMVRVTKPDDGMSSTCHLVYNIWIKVHQFRKPKHLHQPNSPPTPMSQYSSKSTASEIATALKEEIKGKNGDMM